MAEKKPITNQVIEAIQKRRSVRSYKPDPIPSDILNTLIEAGNMAPTGLNRQPWRFVVVEDPEFRRKLQKEAFSNFQKRVEGWKETDPERYERWKERETRWAEMGDPRGSGTSEMIYFSAPVILFVIGTGKGVTEMADCSMVSHNIMLAAYSLGIGSCWVNLGNKVTGNPGIVKALELKEGERLYGPIILGYPKVYPEPPPKKPPVAKWI